MNYFDQALVTKQKDVEATALLTQRYMQRRRFFLALANRVRKICPHKVQLDICLGGGINNYGVFFYVTDTRSKSPKDLLPTLFKLEKLFGELRSTVIDNGESVSYSGGKGSTLGKFSLYLSLSYTWHKPADSTCMIVVTGQRTVEAWKLVKAEEPIYQVVCP